MKPLSRHLEYAFEQREIVKAARARQAFRKWPEVVGAAMADRSWPDRYEAGTVFVAVTGHAWAQELRLRKPMLVQRLRELCGAEVAIADIRFGVRPLPPRPKVPKERPERPETEESFQAVRDRILSRVEDEA